MKPIKFACHETLTLAPESIAEQIIDVSKWLDFRGNRLIPGIKSAEFETRTPNVVGTRIRVTNLDGSSHVEEIVEWKPDRRFQLQMGSFSEPLSRLATAFVETWDFERFGNETKVTRSFELNAKSKMARPVLWFISFLLQRAIARHLGEIKHFSDVYLISYVGSKLHASKPFTMFIEDGIVSRLNPHEAASLSDPLELC